MRIAPFERLTTPATLWYFLALLLVAATVMRPRVELEILLVLCAGILLCGERGRLGRTLAAGIGAGLAVGVVTLLLHYQGDHLLAQWGPVTITTEGVRWAVCLGLGMAVIVLSSLLQTLALRRSSLVPGLSRVAMRVALICAMALAIIPSVAVRLRQLFVLEQAASCSQEDRRHADGHPCLARLRTLTYAILAETLEDASERVSTLSLLGGARSGVRKGGAQKKKTIGAPDPDEQTGVKTGTQTDKQTAIQTAMRTSVKTTGMRTDARITVIAPGTTGQAKRVRSWVFSVVVTVLFALVLLPSDGGDGLSVVSGMPADGGAALSGGLHGFSLLLSALRPEILPDIPAILLTALPFVFEGGGRLWSRSRA